MAVSLELRAPILDHELMEMVASIPSHLKLHGDTGKYIFKKSFESILPANILYRRKQGFAVPLDQWFRRELKEVAYEAIMNHGRRHSGSEISCEDVEATSGGNL